MNNLLLWLPRVRNRHFFFADTIVFLVTPVLSLLLCQGQPIDVGQYLRNLAIVTALFTGIKLVLLYKCGLYKHYWRYASIDELLLITEVTVAVIVLQILSMNGFNSIVHSAGYTLPQALPVLDGLLSFILIAAMRFSIRASNHIRPRPTDGDRTLIVGAGSAGASLVEEMRQNPQLGFEPVAFIDDNPRKANLRVRGLPIVGDRHSIPSVVEACQIEKIIIAMPSVVGQSIREIAEICRTTGAPTSTLPGIHEILRDRVRVQAIREIQIEDLLRREPIQTDIHKVARLIRGKTVLITGAGGSIGSELCRQILNCQPAELLLIGKGENSIFMIEQELKQTVQTWQVVPRIKACIVDIRSRLRLSYLFEQYQPDIVFHAAAHKHVPLMELNSPEAITSNVLGTQNLLDVCLQHQVNHFVMISTDKVVNPTSVMGASKRVAEMLVLQTAKRKQKPYIVVRFGNVLGSRGSVIPTFRQQIAMGGPITITHPEICRYFMTIPEAVQLVLQAAILGGGGEVLMLDMGEPVKIVDLAKDLIRLSGYDVGKDIELTFTGLRPGEKLYEELFIPGEQYERTNHDKILIARNASTHLPSNLDSVVEMLCKAAHQNDTNAVLFLLEQLVTGYQPNYTASPPSEPFESALIRRPERVQKQIYQSIQNAS